MTKRWVEVVPCKKRTGREDEEQQYYVDHAERIYEHYTLTLPEILEREVPTIKERLEKFLGEEVVDCKTYGNSGELADAIMALFEKGGKKE